MWGSVCEHQEGKQQSGVMQESERGDQGAQASAWMDAIAEKDQDGETTQHVGCRSREDSCGLLTLDSRTSQGELWGPGQQESQEQGWRCPNVTPFFRPGMKFVYGFWQLWVPVVTQCSCGYESGFVLWQPRAMLLNHFASHCQCSVRALAAKVLVVLLYRGMVQASSTISPASFEPAGWFQSHLRGQRVTRY